MAATKTDTIHYNKLSVSGRRVSLLGSPYVGALFNEKGVQVNDFIDLYYANAGSAYTISGYNGEGEVWNVIYDPDEEKTEHKKRTIEAEYTGNYKLRYYGGTRMLRVQNEEDKVTVPLYRAGNTYSDGLYSGFEPATLKTKNVTALTTT